MAFVIEKNEPLPSDGDFNLEIQVDPTDKGVRIFIKSPEIEKFFKRASPKGSIPIPDLYTGRNCYFLNGEEVPPIEGCFFYGIGQPLILEGDFRINLSFLRSLGIGEGITFEVEGIFPPAWFNVFTTLLDKGLRDFYTACLKPKGIKMSWSSKKVE